MDDLRKLGTTLSPPEPSAATLARSRERLAATIHGTRRRRRTGWLTGGLGLAAAAVAATVVIAGQGPGPERPMTGRQVLLAAAATAESRPAQTGLYWQVKSVSSKPDSDGIKATATWTTRDGVCWISLVPGWVSRLPKRQGFPVGGRDLTYEQVQHLPADPARLKAMFKDPKNPFPGVLINALEDLLYNVPAQPKVVAAAYRALASLPDIQNLGKVRGGQSLLFQHDDAGSTMVVDPKTLTVANGGFTSFGGKRQPMGGTLTMTGQWTNRVPGKVVTMETQSSRRDN